MNLMQAKMGLILVDTYVDYQAASAAERPNY
jgi:hypothetical protein